jgi:hypothetical protein
MNRLWLEGLAKRHEDAASAIREGLSAAAHPAIIPTADEHDEIVQAVRILLRITAEQRAEFAKAAMQGLLAGMCVDPGNLISGPQVAATAVDMADNMLEALAGSAR